MHTAVNHHTVGDHTEYAVVVTTPTHTHRAQARYSAFDKFNTKAKKAAPPAVRERWPHLAPWTWFWTKTMTPAFVEKRAGLFRVYVDALFRLGDDVTGTELFRAFFQAEPTGLGHVADEHGAEHKEDQPARDVASSMASSSGDTSYISPSEDDEAAEVTEETAEAVEEAEEATAAAAEAAAQREAAEAEAARVAAEEKQREDEAAAAKVAAQEKEAAEAEAARVAAEEKQREDEAAAEAQRQAEEEEGKRAWAAVEAKAAAAEQKAKEESDALEAQRTADEEAAEAAKEAAEAKDRIRLLKEADAKMKAEAKAAKSASGVSPSVADPKIGSHLNHRLWEFDSTRAKHAPAFFAGDDGDGGGDGATVAEAAEAGAAKAGAAKVDVSKDAEAAALTAAAAVSHAAAAAEATKEDEPAAAGGEVSDDEPPAATWHCSSCDTENSAGETVCEMCQIPGAAATTTTGATSTTVATATAKKAGGAPYKHPPGPPGKARRVSTPYGRGVVLDFTTPFSMGYVDRETEIETARPRERQKTETVITIASEIEICARVTINRRR